MIILLVEHLIAYLFNIYRNWELKNYGKPTTLGIITAPCESKLKLLEIIVDFVIIVVVMIHFAKGGNEVFNDNPLNNTQNYYPTTKSASRGGFSRTMHKSPQRVEEDRPAEYSAQPRTAHA